MPANDGKPVETLEDISSIHTAAIVQEWFAKHPEIIRVPLFPKSPDLNPMENLWSRTISDWCPTIRTENELRTFVQEKRDFINND